MTREQLKNKHHCITVQIQWTTGIGNDHKLIITYGFNEQHQIKEAFIAGMRIEATLNALANDACILYSRCLQHGDSVEEIAATMVENRREGEASGEPASIMGAIARKAVEVQYDMNKTDR